MSVNKLWRKIYFLLYISTILSKCDPLKGSKVVELKVHMLVHVLRKLSVNVSLSRSSQFILLSRAISQHCFRQCTLCKFSKQLLADVSARKPPSMKVYWVETSASNYGLSLKKKSIIVLYAPRWTL